MFKTRNMMLMLSTWISSIPESRIWYQCDFNIIPKTSSSQTIHLRRNHTGGKWLTSLCHDWCVSWPKPITTQRCESLPLTVVTPVCSNIRSSLTHKQPTWSFSHPHIKCVDLCSNCLWTILTLERCHPYGWMCKSRNGENWPLVTDQPVELEKLTRWSSRLQKKKWSVWRNLRNIP
jgi:hypothetical protein